MLHSFLKVLVIFLVKIYNLSVAERLDAVQFFKERMNVLVEGFPHSMTYSFLMPTVVPLSLLHSRRAFS